MAEPLSNPAILVDTDAKEQATRATLQRRARLGVVVLGARTVLSQLTVLAGNIVLARLLAPSDFGVFAIVQFALAIFAVFGDAGLGPALIQKREMPTQRELSSIWWIQVLFSSAVIGVASLLAPVVLRIWPDLPPETVWLMRGLSLSLLFTSLRVVPAILLERDLKFAQLAVVELASTLSFYGSACVLAALGYGSASLVSAVVAQALVGALLIQAFRPWRPSLVLDRALLQPILRFGFAYQGKTIVSFGNSAVTPLVAGGLLGKAALGLNNFAQSTAYFSLRLVEIISRVNFPLYSRLQDDRVGFARGVERSIQLCGIATLFLVGVFWGMGENVIRVIYTDKWLPALPVLWIYAGAISVGFISPIIGSALDALGRPQTMLRLATAWTALNWISVLVAMLLTRNLVVFALAYSVHVVVGNIATVWVIRRVVPEIRIWRRLWAPFAAALVTAVVSRQLLHPWASDAPRLAAAVLGALAVFFAVTCIFDRSVLSAIRVVVQRRTPA